VAPSSSLQSDTHEILEHAGDAVGYAPNAATTAGEDRVNHARFQTRNVYSFHEVSLTEIVSSADLAFPALLRALVSMQATRFQHHHHRHCHLCHRFRQASIRLIN
jgi:hypothetical protein